MSFGVDITKAPVPTRRYVCELCSVGSFGGDARIVFAQSSLDSEALDSALIVRMNAWAAQQFINSIDTMKSPSLDEIAASIGIVETNLSPIATRPLQMANVIANFAAVAVSGFETCIDFYHASAFAMREADSKNELSVEPVVRVDIQTSVFLAFRTALKALSVTFPPLPQELS